MAFNALVDAIVANRVLPSRHSLSEAANDDLKLGEIYASVIEGGEIIEDYPNAYPMPLPVWSWGLTRSVNRSTRFGVTIALGR